jgi:hypothetical protein
MMRMVAKKVNVQNITAWSGKSASLAAVQLFTNAPNLYAAFNLEPAARQMRLSRCSRVHKQPEQGHRTQHHVVPALTSKRQPHPHAGSCVWHHAAHQALCFSVHWQQLLTAGLAQQLMDVCVEGVQRGVGAVKYNHGARPAGASSSSSSCSQLALPSNSPISELRVASVLLMLLMTTMGPDLQMTAAAAAAAHGWPCLASNQCLC